MAGIRDIPRARDVEVLTALRLITSGLTLRAVAERLGVSPSDVSVWKQRVMADDLKFSGEPAHVVRAGYEP